VAVDLLVVIVRDDFGVQGRSDEQRVLLDAESVAGHLLKADSAFAFLAMHKAELFTDKMFADLFPSGGPGQRCASAGGFTCPSRT
jgi:hypothetical protein